MDGDQIFIVTHPFHPQSGQHVPLLAVRFTWGERRVFFIDPSTNQVRSLPLAWTDLAPPDPFVELAAGRALLRLADVQAVVRLLYDWTHTHDELQP